MDPTVFVDRPEAAPELAQHEIKLEKFSGPLDLLLYLIRKDEMDIKDIPIAHITRQYLDYLDIMAALDLEVAGEYILMAATLIRIKAQMLLPRPEEADMEEDPRGALVAALLEYQQFKEASGMLHGHESDARRRFANPGNMPRRRIEETLRQDASVYDLVAAMGELLKRARQDAAHEVFDEAYHIEDQINVITERLKLVGSPLLSELLGDTPTRAYLVVNFLALLELTRQHLITIEQVQRFRDIRINRRFDPPGVQTEGKEQ
jgi:segregation and condensation protein A